MVGSASSGVTVGDDAMGSWVGTHADVGVEASNVDGVGVEKGLGSDIDGPRVVAGVRSTVVGASVIGPNVGANVEVGVGLIEVATGVGAGEVPTSNEGAVGEMVVDDERVVSGEGSSGVGPLAVVGNVVRSASSGVAVENIVVGS